MAFYLSPGVYVKEYDLTTIVPAVGTTEGAFAGDFVWGPINDVMTISNEIELVNTFGRPNANTFRNFFTCANFLSYAQNLKVVRSANTVAARNATGAGNGVLIENRDKYEINYLGLPASANINGMFAAKYAGEAGNSLRVSLWADANTTNYPNWEYFEQFPGAPGTSIFAQRVTGASNANDEMHIIVVDKDGKFSGGIANTVLEKFSYVSKAIDAKNDDGSSNYYVNVINDRSRFVYVLNHAANVSNAVIGSGNIVSAGQGYANGYITDAVISGSATGNGANISLIVNASGNITSLNVISGGSGYKTADNLVVDLSSFGAGNGGEVKLNLNLNTETTTWGTEALPGKIFTQTNPGYTESLSGGKDGLSTDANIITAYDFFSDPEKVDVSLVMNGAHSPNVARHIIDNIVGGTFNNPDSGRRDCVAFISPRYTDVVDNAGNEAEDCIDFRNNIIARSTSYAVMDNNWKYQFDKYNNVYRWVPLNGDIAGLCVRTDFERDPWFSPAGFNRGQIKNVVKLAWNAGKASRDDIYKNNINPVVSFPGEGVVLYGDKTLQAKPSAFDRINVRRLFIVLEKAIARAARYSLFEFNDEFTRSQFIALVEPFLRDVKGRRGIFDFRVVCDTTNNTPEVIDRNEFIGDIYIKPARSINFIQLNFIAVRTGVAFEEIVGKY